MRLKRLAISGEIMKRSVRAARAFAAALAAAICSGSMALADIPVQVPIPQERPKLETSKIEQPVFRSYKKEIGCLAKAIYFEARGEPVAGQTYVARVILNRVDSPFYPPTICDVVYQNDHLKNACQFSFACDGIADRIAEPKAYSVAMEVAKRNFGCDKECRETRGPLSRSTHYHAISVDPWWAAKLERTGKVGNHVFYYTSTL